MRGTRPSAKRQTRLNFTPIAPSSPGFEHSSQVPDRFANVRYSPASSSPLTRRAAARRELPSSGPFRSGKTRNESSFDDDDSDEDEIVAASSARRPRSRVSPPSSPTPIRGRKFEVSDREESENGEEAEDSDEDIRAVTSVRRARKHYSPPHKTDRSSAPAQNVLDSEDEDDDDEQEIRVPGSTRKKSRREVIKLSDDDNDSDEDSDDIIQSPAKRRRRDSEPRTPVRVHGRSEQDMRDLEEDLEILRNSGEPTPLSSYLWT